MSNLSPITIREIAIGFQKSRVVLTAFELGLFTALDDGSKSSHQRSRSTALRARSKSSSQVAKALRTDERATDRLMNALCAIGLLRKTRGRFSNTPAAQRYLVKGKPEYMAGLMHTVHLWNTWSTLTQAVRRGTSAAARHAGESAPIWRTAFIAAMHERAGKLAPSVVGMLDLSRVSRVLDVGGGSGAYAMAFARAKKGLKATVFDLPDVIPLTRGYVRREGLSDRIDFVPGDYTINDLAGGSHGRVSRSERESDLQEGSGHDLYDLVFLSAIVHSNSVIENRMLIRRCASALNPGGQVVVQDFIMNENRTGPASAALFALNMLVGTEAGDTYTENEVRSWMRGAGLRRIIRKDTEFGTTLVIGRKGR